MMNNQCSILIPESTKPKPSKEEIDVAYILARYFGANVKFINRSNHKTPDFLIKNKKWELKTPTGNGKHNIQHCIQDAIKQSPNIVMDNRKSKLHPNKFLHEAKYQFDMIKVAKRLIIIEKSGKIVEMHKKKC